MKKVAGYLVNLLLVIFSMWLVFVFVSFFDGVLGRMAHQSFEPGKMGMLFVPNMVESFEMIDYSTTETINSFGIRDHEYPLERKDRFRIVAIGDSFTYGWGVEIDEAWCKQLERHLTEQGLKVEVLNLGKPAAGPPEYAWMAETLLPILKPDLVLVGVLAGDDLQQGSEGLTLRSIARANFPNALRLALRNRTQFMNFGPSIRNAAETRERAVSVAVMLMEGMTELQRERFAALPTEVQQAFHEGRLNPWMLQHATGAPDYFMNTLSLDDLEDKITDMSDAFVRLKRAIDNVDAEALVISIPEGFYVNREAYENVQLIGFQVVPEMLSTRVPDEAVALACARADFPFISATDDFRARMEEGGFYLKYDRHMSAKGNALLAESVLPAVKSMLPAASSSDQ